MQRESKRSSDAGRWDSGCELYGVEGVKERISRGIVWAWDRRDVALMGDGNGGNATECHRGLPFLQRSRTFHWNWDLLFFVIYFPVQVSASPHPPSWLHRQSGVPLIGTSGRSSCVSPARGKPGEMEPIPM